VLCVNTPLFSKRILLPSVATVQALLESKVMFVQEVAVEAHVF